MGQSLKEKYTKKYLDTLQEKLYTAVICDILDELGYRDQAMTDDIAPLNGEDKLIGFAKTILSYDVCEMPDKPYEKEIEAIDSLKPGDVAVVSTGKSKSNGFWGELLATTAIARGSRGVVCEGAVRDIRQLKLMSDKFKVFSGGRNPLDSKGRCIVAEYDRPVLCGGVKVNPGDMVFGDIDGVVVIPQDIADEVLEKALKKVSGENEVRKDLRSGMMLKEAFAKHGIL